MSKAQPPVEAGNALEIDAYRKTFLPSLDPSLQHSLVKSNTTYQITLASAATISEANLDNCFDILKSTSQQDYITSGGGWRPRQKREEMKLPDMRYLLVRQSPAAELEGFASFMLTYEDGREVVYLYEVHLREYLRGKGLGKRLLELVEEAGRRAGMELAMLTVFKVNENARDFYAALGYAVDDYSPQPRQLRSGVIKEFHYEILSKTLK